MSEQVVVYSHGFGVRKDDRGLFTDIAAALPEAESVMFDYGSWDEEHKEHTLSSYLFSEQPIHSGFVFL